MLKVLVIEDDGETRNYLRAELRRAGYLVSAVGSVAEGREALVANDRDVVVLDRMLPDGDGLVFIDEIRRNGLNVPFLILSALGDVGHRVEGLQAGGDDYLVKPFDVVELLARIEVLHRRSQSSMPVTVVRVGRLVIDLLSHRVSREGREIRLQPREYK